MADAEAISEAVSRPTMRFVTVKLEEQQAQDLVFRTRDLLLRQRTQTINALRGHFAEYGVIAQQGTAHIDRLMEAIEDLGSGLQEPVRTLGRMILEQIANYDEKIKKLELDILQQRNFNFNKHEGNSKTPGKKQHSHTIHFSRSDCGCKN